MLRSYLLITKPGIIFGNLITAVAGYVLAAKGNIDFVTFTAMIVGTVCIIASGCVFNNVIDRDIDQLMSRTKYRKPLLESISVTKALAYATLLGCVGFASLALYASMMSFYFGVLGFVVYVGLYTLYYKRKSIYGTFVGSISGACPPVMGYCAVNGQFDIGAVVILAIFCIWQIPHSYAIAIYRFKDYKDANIPVLPIVSGVEVARKHMIGFIVAFTVLALSLFTLNYVGAIFASLTFIIGLVWLLSTIFDFHRMDNHTWAKRVFILSLVAITSMSVLMSVDFAHIDPTSYVTAR
ncbi:MULTISPECIES: heme o synthase [Pseudoalteromonas]|uniref:Protoheme IX farnesyltransferase n=2 Tax=Pseudoalteromonas TaxID=53246 RepID=V4HTN1_PSEL2|nr:MULTISPECIES: heme o synthase [Pseudoalteromonas]ESP93153.1 protoheme IX farnesyltransferase [Pseudoalteromonas luteoviolacea 2ta16]KZN37026.1 hypothetical protein N483_21510 [Pseudoalteromonas luteoviolacea NCIMB 1944]MBQ4835859.1 heme o synthase [Pseudoalteromonas luteoviolacea]MCG7549954.1 heme o synthase [Pseudoalteromonas sp. Of7M-16]MDK2593896.1 heme o synthase [Pseudoalteromonas sp. P94(2023)]